jgi:hypothetical protein
MDAGKAKQLRLFRGALLAIGRIANYAAWIAIVITPVHIARGRGVWKTIIETAILFVVFKVARFVFRTLSQLVNEKVMAYDPIEAGAWFTANALPPAARAMMEAHDSANQRKEASDE